MIDIDLLQKLIITYSWTAAGFLLIFVSAIAKFYQKKFGIPTYYYIYLVPILILFAAAAFNLFYANKLLSELIEFIGTATSFIVIFFIYRIMMGVK